MPGWRVVPRARVYVVRAKGSVFLYVPKAVVASLVEHGLNPYKERLEVEWLGAEYGLDSVTITIRIKRGGRK